MYLDSRHHAGSKMAKTANSTTIIIYTIGREAQKSTKMQTEANKVSVVWDHPISLP